MLISLAVGIGAGLATAYQYRTGRSPGRLSMLVWLIGALAVAILASVYLFQFLRADALSMWPNGYKP